MNTLTNLSAKEIRIMENIRKTTTYFYDAIQENDLDAAKLELEELKIAMIKLEELKIKRERRKSLIKVVMDMKKKGINIDFACRPSFLSSIAKNAVETNRNSENKHEKSSKLEGAHC